MGEKLYRWTADIVPYGDDTKFNNEFKNLRGLPNGDGMLYLDNKLIYAGNMKAGRKHDEIAWALVYINNKYVGLMGTFNNDDIVDGTCDMYPKPYDTSSKISGIISGGKFEEITEESRDQPFHLSEEAISKTWPVQNDSSRFKIDSFCLVGAPTTYTPI
jgi:hypothetical protein